MDQIVNKIRNKPQLLVAALAIYFAVGIGLFLIPETRSLFILLTSLIGNLYLFPSLAAAFSCAAAGIALLILGYRHKQLSIFAAGLVSTACGLVYQHPLPGDEEIAGFYPPSYVVYRDPSRVDFSPAELVRLAALHEVDFLPPPEEG